MFMIVAILKLLLIKNSDFKVSLMVDFDFIIFLNHNIYIELIILLAIILKVK